MRRTLFVLLLCAAALPTAPAAAAPKSTSYGGATRDGAPIVLEADAKGKKLRSVAFSFTVTCPSGVGFPIVGAPRVVPMPAGDQIPLGVLLATRNAGGRFETSLALRLDVPEPNTAMLSIQIDGNLKPRTSRGTLTATVVISNSQTGEMIETCTMDPVKWTASHAPGRVFTGRTADDEPVIAVVNARRSKVTLLRFGWYTDDCAPEGGFVHIGDALGDLPLRRGRFREAFSQDYQLQGDISVHFEYDVTVKVSRSKASGSFRITYTRTAADGTQTVCELPTTTWRATSR